MDRLTIVSCDCHAATTPAEYREYLEPAYPEGYDALQANPEAVRRRAAQIIGPSAPSGDGDGELRMSFRRPCGAAFRSEGRRPE